MSERQATTPAAEAPAKAPAASRQLQIVVDDRPAPVGAPIDVLPARTAPPPLFAPPLAAAAPAPQAAPAMMAPARSLEGLIRARMAPPAPQPTPPQPAVKPRLARLVVAALAAPRPAAPKAVPVHAGAKPPAPAHLAKATPPRKPAAAKVDLARAATVKGAAHRLELAQAAKAAKAEKQEHLRLAKAAYRQQLELAKAEAKGRAEARAEARAVALAEARDDERKRIRLASLVHAFQRVLPHAARSQAGRPHAAPVEVAKLDRRRGHRARHEPRVEQASLKTRKASHIAPPSYRAHAVRVAPPPHASGLMRVSAPRCANRDPGEALVCADPSLGAADRQLARAYQSARAAGVPDADLRQQQLRWLSARSSAAREAPWAVHDVYLARIAELNGQAREAHGDGY